MAAPFGAVSLTALLAGSALTGVPVTTAPERCEGPRIEFRQEGVGRIQMVIDGQEALVYRYGDDVDLPHYYPVRGPSGQPLTVEQTDPYPHHRSVWFADTVRLAGQRRVSFYDAYYTRLDPKDPQSPYRDRIRHQEFTPGKSAGNEAELSLKLLWEMDRKGPVLDESRWMRLVALGEGEYLVDLKFTLTASYGDVDFESDATHYAWPFVRMSAAYSVEKGGSITNSEGGVNQAKTHNQTARWVDYSNTVQGQAEGLALFSHPDNGPPPRWLTRDYGTFGPRRADAHSGKKFNLQKGAQLSQRVGLLVHRGDVKGGRVAERYRLYVEWKP
jgi:hypothetical protein